VARCRGDHVEPSVLVAGGPGESVLEPRWGPDGALYFQSDRSGWWNLHRWDGATVTPVAPMALDCAAAPWEPGYRGYGFLPGGRIGLIQKHGYRDVLAVRQPDGTIQPITLPYTSLRPYLVAHGDRLAVIGSSPSTGPHVVITDPDQSRPLQVIARAPEPDVRSSTPEHVGLRAADGSELNALVYPPTGASASWRAPLIVCPHPGPTDNIRERRDWRVQFFTARGYAVAAVDYRGSTGYGRAFRESLYGHWGDYDVADCRTVAEHLIDARRAVVGRVFISGESAGGYTALKAVSDPTSPFVAAVAALSIVDPRRWQQTAARFQRPHARRLAGPAGAVRAAEIRRPVLLMHGSEDTIAPVRDVVELADALADLGSAHRLIVFDGAGHGFSRPADAEAALDAELGLYEQFSAQ
jgi:dipeptidyl aminopeptidase/acylaminoacyl peptidase